MAAANPQLISPDTGLAHAVLVSFGGGFELLLMSWTVGAVSVTDRQSGFNTGIFVAGAVLLMTGTLWLAARIYNGVW